jgi:predicted 2-oxoglutarate/Fe(II)-dependent dioxygenase YbiX
MDLKKYIGVYDNFIPYQVLSNLLKYCNDVNFEKAKIIGDNNDPRGIEDTNIRKTMTKYLNNVMTTSYTEMHWANYLTKIFFSSLKRYQEDKKIIDFSVRTISNISLLKYENTGFYTWHVDHEASVPRTMSMIFMLNNDYDGGDLCFREPDGSNEIMVNKTANRLIVWPSNFLYPHTVKPVTKGTRYSVVCWAL